MNFSRRFLLSGASAFATAACANLHLHGSVVGAPNLNTLTLSNNSALDTVTPGTVLANIQGLTSGSSLVLTSPTDGRFTISGTTLVAGSTAQTDGVTNLVFTETKAGYANSPKPTTIPFTISAAPSIPNVSPGALWNGTAASGYNGTYPPVTSRTTAKPAAQWWTKNFSRFGDGTNLLVGVDAEALAGIAYVDFYVEGTVQRVSAPSLYIDTSPYDGSVRSRYGWWITINNAACLAKTSNATGALDLYAIATPNDGTMQPQTIGNPNSNVGGGLRVYAAQKQYDWVTTVNSGQAVVAPSAGVTGNYHTIMDAMLAFSNATAECADIYYTENGTFDGGYPTTGFGGRAGKGLSRLRVASANTVNIVRYNAGSSFGTAFDPTRGRSGPTTTKENARDDPWQWVLPVSNVELVGSNFIVDMHNFFSISNWTSRNDVISLACKITNSAGTSASTYWNGQFKAVGGMQALGQGMLYNTYGENAVIEYVTQAGSAGWVQADLQCNFNACLSTPYNATGMINGGVYANAPLANEKYFRDFGAGHTATTPVLTITYSGSATTAWADYEQSSQTLSLFTGGAGRASPVLVHAYVFAGSNGGGGVPGGRGTQITESDANGWDFIASIVADIHSGRFPNWDATYVDSLNRNFNVQAVSGQITGTFDAKTTTPIYCFLDIHSEFVHYLAGSVSANCLLRSKKVYNCGFGTQFINQENRPLQQDSYLVNLAYDGGGTSTSPSSWGGSGCVIMGCAWDEGIVAPLGVSDSYTKIVNFIGNQISGAGGTLDIACVNCVAGAGPAGTILLADTTYATFAAQFNGSATGDFTIKAGSTVALNKVARVAGNLYDMNNNPFANPDYAGPSAAGFASPTRPF